MLLENFYLFCNKYVRGNMQLDLNFSLLAHTTSTAGNLSSMNTKSNIWKIQQLMKINKK